jgi:hypothetical protein
MGPLRIIRQIKGRRCSEVEVFFQSSEVLARGDFSNRARRYSKATMLFCRAASIRKNMEDALICRAKKRTYIDNTPATSKTIFIAV